MTETFDFFNTPDLSDYEVTQKGGTITIKKK